jgi:hypothetical protein
MTEAAPPFTVKLERLAYRVAIANLTNLASAGIFDADPDVDASAKPTLLAALMADHHAVLTKEEADPLLARPTYFVRRPGGLELWPHCDKTYWFRATYRAPVKYGTGG